MISICIPVYQQAEYLQDAIESALEQTYPCEIIVCNDGSTDKSLEIAKSYESKGVKVINQVNKGLPSARNTLIMNATQPYILFLDSDDILFENAAQIIKDTIDKTGADIIAPSFKCFGMANETITLMPKPSMEDFKVANRIGYFSAVKREALLEVGGYSPRMYWGWEDYHMWIDLLRRGKTLAVLSDVLVLYRTKEFSMIHVANQHSQELTAQIIKDFPEIYVQ